MSVGSWVIDRCAGWVRTDPAECVGRDAGGFVLLGAALDDTTVEGDGLGLVLLEQRRHRRTQVPLDTCDDTRRQHSSTVLTRRGRVVVGTLAHHHRTRSL